MWVAVSPTRITFSLSKSRTGRLMAPAGTVVGGGLSTAAVAELAAPPVPARSSRTPLVPTTTPAARNKPARASQPTPAWGAASLGTGS